MAQMKCNRYEYIWIPVFRTLNVYVCVSWMKVVYIIYVCDPLHLYFWFDADVLILISIGLKFTGALIEPFIHSSILRLQSMRKWMGVDIRENRIPKKPPSSSTVTGCVNHTCKWNLSIRLRSLNFRLSDNQFRCFFRF